MKQPLKIGGGRCLIIGEVALAHDGNLNFAHAFIDAIASAGADAVKFQTHIAAAESTPAEPFRVKFSRKDATRYEYWKRTEFTEEEWRGLAEHAREKGLLFLSSPFSVEAVDLLTRLGVTVWKIASGELTFAPLLERIASTRSPVLLSTGMSSLAEIDAAVERIRAHDLPLVLMQATSAYPCPPEKVGLNLLQVYRERYGCGVGLSDHSGTEFPGLAAATLGIDVLEVHVTLSREMFGPDVPVSLTPAELRHLVEGVRFIERMKAHPVDKDAVAKDLGGIRGIFTKSLVARGPLKAGTVLEERHLASKKPGQGIPLDRLREVVGRRLRRDLAADALLQGSDIEGWEER